MNWQEFKTRVPGKWVLAGEHSVLKGATAVAVPHFEVGLTLRYEPGHASASRGSQTLVITPDSAQSLLGELLGAIASLWAENGKEFRFPRGKLEIDSTIPIGAGLGSSAAVCVALTEWLSGPLQLASSQKMGFATRLENHFHGKSSGMDVAAISSGEPILFSMNEGIRSLGIKKLPRFTIHDTGLRSRTSECVQKVEAFRENAPALGIYVDELMKNASHLAMEGLSEYDHGDSKKGLSLIQESMKQSRECFYSWELVPRKAKDLEEDLLKQGALAVKLTGAGGGGMVVALWE